MTCLQDVSMSELQSNTEYIIKFSDKDIEGLKSLASTFNYVTLEETLSNLVSPQISYDDNPFEVSLRAVSLIAPHINILEKTRRDEVVLYRIIVSEYLRNRGLSLSQIGRLLNKNHATIIHYLEIGETSILHPRMYRTLTEKRRAFYTVMLQFEKLSKKK